MSKNSSYKYCIVPCCTSTTVKTSEKLFFHVPKDPAKREAWTKAMKRDDKFHKLSCKSTLWCCEDHFSLSEDLENYWQWKLMKDVKRVQLKPGVMPHIFDCQKQKPVVTKERSAVKKRKYMHLVQDAISSQPSTAPSTSSDGQNKPDDAPATSHDVPATLHDVPGTSHDVPGTSYDTFRDSCFDKAIQVSIKKPYRSKGTNTHVQNASVACATEHMGVNVGTSISPEKFQENVDSVCSDSSGSDYEPTKEVESSDNFSSEDEAVADSKYKEHMVAGTIMSIEKEPKLFLGIPRESLFLIKLLADRSNLPVNHIYLVLKKIRLNLQFAVLAVDFGLTPSTACRIFSQSLPLIASLMQELIVWPDRKAVQARLPIPFRARYGRVISIIDCLEIEIEKPSDPVRQALTWSAYYNCNTLKYLVSCTPNGLVSFVSEGFGGRISDQLIVEHSKFLENLTSGDFIMADRGFKQISNLLQQKGCFLVRPPSVSSATKSTKQEVKHSKRIAALRIHVERVIGRLRDFKMLSPHACVDRQHIQLIDYIIIIACGIINMHDPLIKM